MVQLDPRLLTLDPEETNPEAVPGSFPSSRYHLLAELGLLDLRIRLLLGRARLHASDPYQGLYIAEEEVDQLLEQAPAAPLWSRVEHAKEATSQLAHLRQTITQRAARSEATGIELRLRRVQRAFRLSQLEVDALVVCLAPEADLRYERLYAYLQDDVTQRRPTLELLLGLLCASFEARWQARRTLLDGPLIARNLLRSQENSDRPGALSAQALRLEPWLVEFLLDGPELPKELAPLVTILSRGTAAPKTTVANAESTPYVYLEAAAETLAQRLERAAPGTLLVIDDHEPDDLIGLGKLLGQRLEAPLHLVDVTRLDASSPLETIVWIANQATLSGAEVIWSGVMDLPESQWHRLGTELRRLFAVPLIVGSGRLRSLWPNVELIDLPRFDFEARRQLWQRLLPTLPTPHANRLASSYQISASKMQQVVAGLHKEHPDEEPTYQRLAELCQEFVRPRLGALARRLECRQSWDDLILPRDQTSQLRELTAHVRHRAEIYETWGFGKRGTLGRGIRALFAGPSGTGKTMAAGILANDLGLDVFRIDLSRIVSKYIGETEKNLSQIFDQAQETNSLLFFDEADSLFGKRSEVKDAHDRYANIEVAYLLQKLEDFHGVTILATNLRRNIDDAFTRRIDHVINFPVPETQDRLSIWKRSWPSLDLLESDVDLEFLAARFKLTGGHIHNIALCASVLAASAGTRVTMRQVIHATRRELQKLGKVCVESEFGPYFAWLEEEGHTR